ncbi:MAG: transcription elongation factor GreA [Chitinophagales bacterium]
MAVKYYNQEDLDKLKAELHDLKKRGRREMAREIADARDKGDLSENAEYDAAKEKQGHLEARIAFLEGEIGDARILDESKIADTTKVMILSKVKVRNLKFNKVMNYILVSPSAADLKKGKLSINTPIAKGLMGHKAGDMVAIKVPRGVMKFEILEVGR